MFVVLFLTLLDSEYKVFKEKLLFLNIFLWTNGCDLLIQSLLEERESLTTSLDVSVSRIQDLERKQREHEGIIR
jgi:hypothetical protein